MNEAVSQSRRGIWLGGMFGVAKLFLFVCSYRNLHHPGDPERWAANLGGMSSFLNNLIGIQKTTHVKLYNLINSSVYTCEAMATMLGEFLMLISKVLFLGSWSATSLFALMWLSASPRGRVCFPPLYIIPSEPPSAFLYPCQWAFRWLLCVFVSLLSVYSHQVASWEREDYISFVQCLILIASHSPPQMGGAQWRGKVWISESWCFGA